MWLDRATAAKCYMLSAPTLVFASCDTPTHRRWIPMASRFSEAAELRYVRWLEIHGKMDSKMLLPQHKTYAAYIVFRLCRRHYGLQHPCQKASVSLGGSDSARRVCLDDGRDPSDDPPWLRGNIPQDALFPQERGDGWMELELGEFHSGEGEDGEVSISLMELCTSKGGLVVLGVEFRPKKEQGIGPDENLALY